MPATIIFSLSSTGAPDERVVPGGTYTGIVDGTVLRVNWADLNTIPSDYLTELRDVIEANPSMSWIVATDLPEWTLEYIGLDESYDGPELPTGTYLYMRSAPATAWANGLILGDGEIGVDETTGAMVMGNGVDEFDDLDPWPPLTGLDTSTITSFIINRYTSLLARASYVTSGSVIESDAGTTLLPVDATNLVVSFEATTPAVEVEFAAYGRNDNASGTLVWGLIDASTGVAVPGSSAVVVSGNTLARRFHTVFIEGLTPGTTYTWQWGQATNGTGNAETRHSPTWGPAVMKVRSVPDTNPASSITAPAMRNVKAYGAVGNGSVNDTVSIQNAIDDAAADGGGAVFIPAGEYIVDTLTLKKRVKLIGEGRSTTRLKALSGSTAKGVLQIATGDVTYVEVESIGLSGNGNANQWGMYFYAQGDGGTPNDGGLWFSSFKNMNIMQFEAGSVWLRGGGASNLCPHQFISFEDCRMSYDTTAPPSTWIGLRMTGQVGQINCRNVQTSSKNGAGIGVQIIREVDDAGANVSDRMGYNILFSGCTTERVATGIQVQRAFGVSIINHYFEAVDYCIDVSTSAGMVVCRDSTFSDCAQDGSGTGYLMRVSGANSYGVAEGNFAWGGTEDQTWITASSGTLDHAHNHIT